MLDRASGGTLKAFPSACPIPTRQLVVAQVWVESVDSTRTGGNLPVVQSVAPCSVGVRGVNVVLSLAMIARDEARSIDRALQSVAPYVDEMIVVDTGSVDRTESVATRAGARVVRFRWIDDFSAARNVALAETRGDVALVIDADEWLVGGGETLRRWADGAPSFGAVTCHNQFGEDGAEIVDRSIRLLPRGALYEGAVHEQPRGDFPTRSSQLVIAHDGYLSAQRERKRGRNERILRRRLETEDGDGYLWYQLGCDLDLQERFDEAANAFGRALQLTPPGAPWRHPLLPRAMYAMAHAGRYAEAMGTFAAGRIEWPDSPDMWFVGADVMLTLGAADPRCAVELAPLVERAWQRCLEIGERPDLAGTVTGRGSFLAQRNLDTLVGLSHGTT